MSQDLRPHITLVRQEYGHKTGFLPRLAWEAWTFLMAEAKRNAALQGKKDTFRTQQLELWLDGSNSVDGWKSELLGRAMSGEQPPKTAPVAAFVTTQNPGDANGHERKRKRGLLERVRG